VTRAHRLEWLVAAAALAAVLAGCGEAEKPTATPPAIVAVQPGAGATGILVTASSKLAGQVLESIYIEGESLETGKAALKAWEENGQVILVDSLTEAAAVSDQFAPEHLELQTVKNDELINKLHNYGSLFIGENAPVAFGDYVSGTNHILPTMSCARFSSGVWAGLFVKVASYQILTAEGAAELAGRYHLGLELECDEKIICSRYYYDLFYKQLNRAHKLGLDHDITLAWYNGSKALVKAVRSSIPQVRAIYDDIHRWISGNYVAPTG
jgi:predicted small lipoprotein YifL